MTRNTFYALCATSTALLTLVTACACIALNDKSEGAPALTEAKPTRIVSPYATAKPETTEAVTESVTESTTESTTELETERVTPGSETQAETTAIDESEYISLGEYKLTAYCACEKCCGAYAKDRPVDKDGNTIVYTASMAEAREGVTVAADTSVHPFGTVLLIDGNEYTVQDRGGKVKGKHVDIYFDSHEEAMAFGLQYGEVFAKGGQADVE